jgi:hypothetical protein
MIPAAKYKVYVSMDTLLPPTQSRCCSSQNAIVAAYVSEKRSLLKIRERLENFAYARMRLGTASNARTPKACMEVYMFLVAEKSGS